MDFLLAEFVIDHHLEFLVLICLLENGLDHCKSLGQVIISFSSNQHIQWLVLISFFLVIDSVLYNNISLDDIYLIL